MLMMGIHGQVAVANFKPVVKYAPCSTSKGLVVSNFSVTSPKIISMFMDAEGNIHRCQVGQTGFFDTYQGNLNIPVLPHEVSSWQCRASWGQGGGGGGVCHCPLSRPGWLVNYICINLRGRVWLPHSGGKS